MNFESLKTIAQSLYPNLYIDKKYDDDLVREALAKLFEIFTYQAPVLAQYVTKFKTVKISISEFSTIPGALIHIWFHFPINDLTVACRVNMGYFPSRERQLLLYKNINIHLGGLRTLVDLLLQDCDAVLRERLKESILNYLVISVNIESLRRDPTTVLRNYMSAEVRNLIYDALEELRGSEEEEKVVFVFCKRVREYLEELLLEKHYELFSTILEIYYVLSAYARVVDSGV